MQLQRSCTTRMRCSTAWLYRSPRPKASVKTSAVVVEQSAATTSYTNEVLEDARKFIIDELPRAFQTGVLTRHWYAANIKFEDPISKFSDYAGYALNVRVLRTLFDLKFDLHDTVIRDGDTIVARWTMEATSRFAPWRPSVVLTGKSYYGVNVCTGKIISHVDVWDSVENSSFPSFEAVLDIAKQLADSTLLQIPDLETPQYSVLLRTSDYEIRKYAPYVVAETAMPRGSGVSGGSGFNELAGYIFGGNAETVKMEMTTPVFTTADPGAEAPSMQFVIESKFGTDTSLLPVPKDTRVSTKVAEGRYAAAARFAGLAPDWDVREVEGKLREALERDGYRCAAGYQLARYNDPLVLPPFRRNEVLIDLEEFSWT